MPPSPGERDESRDFLRQMTILAIVGCLGILVYSARFWASGQFYRILGVGTLVAGAALLSGFLLGFIFAIPRVGNKRKKTSTPKAEDAHDLESDAQPGSVLHNGNLVEISDWLTKIIVGVGLVELHSIPGKLGEWSYFLASGLLPAPCTTSLSCTESLVSGQAAGLAILIFYSTLGFLRGYVWTMIYFQGDLERKLKKAEREKEEERRQKEEERRKQLTANSMISAEASVNENRLDEAMATIDRAIRNDPQNGFPLITKARILKRQAVQFKEPDSPDRKRLLQQAIACLAQAIALLTDKSEAIYNKACYQALLDSKGLKNDILENLKSAFRLNPALRKTAESDGDFSSLRDADPDWMRGIDAPSKA
ncbi:MAG: hypothetical protein ABR905_20965 [Terracidiphilus sp.]|jgi:hypothetical protein